MNFSELNAEYVHLRGSLSTFVGKNALEEVSVTPPASEDEASFLRLIAWGYVLVFEAGRVTIPYLLKLPSNRNTHELNPHISRDLLHDLRTWSFHNLGFTDRRSIQISRRVSLWFLEHGNSNPPSGARNWRRCFQRLCAEIGAILAHCRGAMELVLADEDDREQAIADLKRRLHRNWPAYRFDELVQDCVFRIGQTLNVVSFRENKLAGWRMFLDTIHESDDPEILVARLIERDVLDHFESVLPIDGDDVMDALRIPPGPNVGEALLHARRLFRSGIHDREHLLATLMGEFCRDSDPRFSAADPATSNL